MKIISSLLLAAALCTASAAAQTVTVTIDTVKGKSAPDTAVVSQTKDMAEGEAATKPTVTLQNGRWIMTYNGSEYQISRLLDAACEEAETTASSSDDEINTVFESESNHHSVVPLIVALVFGIPCIGVIAVLIVISVVTLRKTRTRQEIITRAIENNYQLPDTFYNPHKPTDSANGNLRDPRKFSGGVTLAAVGLAVVILAIVEENTFFLICGLIPLFLGIGKIIGYYLLPAPVYPSNNCFSTGPQAQYPRQPQQPYQPQQHTQPWNGNGAPGAPGQVCNPGQPDNQTPPPYSNR